MIFRSASDDVGLLDVPVHDAVLGRSAHTYADRPAFVDAAHGASVTYAGLDAHSRRLAAALAEAGVRKGDVVALHSPNSLVWPGVFYGITRAGATVTPAGVLSTGEELARQLRDSRASWIVTTSALLPTAEDAAKRVGGVREIFVCDRAEGYRSVLDLRESTAPEPRPALTPGEDLAVLPYSSGTTALPKGVMLTHRSVATNLAQQQPLLPTGPDDVILAIMPFSHGYGQASLLHAPLRSGSTVVLLPAPFDLGAFLTAVETYRVTVLYLAPPIVLALVRHPDVADYDLSSVRWALCGAAPLDADLADVCARRLGLTALGNGYGMTEASPGIAATTGRDAAMPHGTAGRIAPSTEIRIVGTEDGRDLGVDEVGEIFVRGPQVMKGYLGQPEETDAMVDDGGWLRTGDVGRIDADGWLFVVDRVKELIKYKGYQVAPAELEGVLLSHPGIADAAVTGVPDEHGGEVPKAFVVRTADAALTGEDVMAYVAGRVAPYKKVRQVAFTDAVPRAASGKILRRRLR
ncbi:acyl-CoA synthetase (AMP-forming)/AMP-acid ligase II [Streptomyces sp. Amel2xB2]|uniref:AMP-binding protein n=1 Tax=Streptomyces sp. Amel2xB2 TaxID=1305829 RepID=UPI000DB9CA68|nr:AMP-binding protein [Streptomyces sp. Amel2xB2]RAJ60507.1 acyl-CoA synthetase (AMP-forming)/AMP-acid ligase II [Streptomyces sp. Amel2xB2]